LKKGLHMAIKYTQLTLKERYNIEFLILDSFESSFLSLVFQA
jgi:hypothetical protein